MAAKFKGGILCATDLAISTGSAQRNMVDGKWFKVDEGLVLFAGTLYYIQEVQFAEGTLRERLLSVREAHDKDDDEDACELLLVSPKGITFYEHYGSYYDCGDYGCVGNSADLADGFLEMVYTPDRSEAWLRSHMDNIFRIVNKKVAGVSREAKYRVVK
jgi:hypothetical protein